MLPIVDDGFMYLKEDTHQYFDQNGQEYNSVSKVIKCFEIPFDSKGISRSMTSSDKEAAALRAEWKKKSQKSIDWGNKIHNECENFTRYGSVEDSQFKKLESQIYKVTKQYSRNHAERILRHPEWRIAGTADHLGERSKRRTKNMIIDINDFKTNAARGVRNEKAKIDDDTKDILKYYNSFFLHPISHLEASDYVKYCLQLSIYGVMLEHYGVRIGSLNLFYVDLDLNITPIFVPYMRMEALAVMESFIRLRKIDGSPASFYLQSQNKTLGEEINKLSPVEEIDDNEWL